MQHRAGGGASEAPRRTVESVFSMIHMLDVIELAVSSTCTRGEVGVGGAEQTCQTQARLACFDSHGTDERSGEMALPSLERLTTCRHGRRSRGTKLQSRRSKRHATTPRSIALVLHANTHE